VLTIFLHCPALRHAVLSCPAHTHTHNHRPGLEIATILVPQGFLVLGSCANMIKGLSWMAGGSTRSVFNLSFVRDNNIAGAAGSPATPRRSPSTQHGTLTTRPPFYHTATTDITAKNTSQYIFASLFGTAAGVSCCAYIGQTAPLALLCFSGLAYTSMYGAYRTVKAIPLPTLNSTRLQLLAARWVEGGGLLQDVHVCVLSVCWVARVADTRDKLEPPSECLGAGLHSAAPPQRPLLLHHAAVMHLHRYLKCVRTSASGAIDGFPSAYLGPESGFMSYQREYEVGDAVCCAALCVPGSVAALGSNELSTLLVAAAAAAAVSTGARGGG
jgi:hypothetical protein